MNKSKNKIIIILASAIFLSSTSLLLTTIKNKELYQLYCNLNSPIEIFYLPDELKEISGIVYLNDKEIACVQDELGKIYIYNLETKNIFELENFQENGDYEGIAYNKNIFYILRSDGLLLEINILEDSIEKFVLATGAKNNEGLTYDKFTNKLLVTTKSKIGQGEELKDKRLIYLFNLETKKLEDNPLFTIELEKIEAYIKNNNLSTEKIKFRPSGIAVHPVNSSIYIISAVDNLIIKFDRQGNILHLDILEKNLYPKPEGITIDQNNNIFISTEGDNSKAALLQSCLTP